MIDCIIPDVFDHLLIFKEWFPITYIILINCPFKLDIFTLFSFRIIMQTPLAPQ